MGIEAASIKPGVLFASTARGGILLDVVSERYIALSPVSSMIWKGLSERRPLTDIIGTLSEAKGIGSAEAEEVFSRQLSAWKRAHLIQEAEAPSVPLPRTKASSVATAEVDASAVSGTPLSFSTMVNLGAIEHSYGRMLRDEGLASTLRRLQVEGGETVSERPDETIHRTLRSYRDLRRPFRQGRSAQECLVRSLGLAATLRSQGVAADLCMGVIDVPFQAHAWVEARGMVLNESLGVCHRFAVIGRF